MALLSLQNISIAFGGPTILDNLSLQLESKQRVCLLGRNGMGKSTLMKIIGGEISPDDGTIHKQNIKISYCAQNIPDDLNGSVFEIVARSLGLRGELFIKYHQEQKRLAENHADYTDTMNQLHEEMATHDGWSALEAVEKIITRTSLNPDWQYHTLSGGQKKRIQLAAALVSEPDLLLLDEPTNHLDIHGISWMEDFLLRYGKTILFVTHDRMLLRKLATRIIELDRGELVDWSCDYDTFLKRKQAVLAAEEKEWKHFDKKLAQEEIWIRKGIKARRTRNEGRVRALVNMREERRKRRQREGAVAMTLADAQKSGTLVIETKNISYRYDDKNLITNFSTRIVRGDKIGIIGPNGCGKTTLINLLLGKLQPLSGTIRQGTNLSVTYYDQLREKLDENKTVWENVLPQGDIVTIDGKNKHIIGYLQDFLFTPERAKTPVKALSGGERNRLLLARLFTKPSNFLILDEPTNDLDAETLELLEELIVNFTGTVLLISHDRAFLNNVVTSTFVFSENETVQEYIGGYDDWLKQKQAQTSPAKEPAKTGKKKNYKQAQKENQKTKLSFKEKRELESLPARIESMEKEQTELQAQMADFRFYENKEKATTTKERLVELEVKLPEAYKRWEYLESIEK